MFIQTWLHLHALGLVHLYAPRCRRGCSVRNMQNDNIEIYATFIRIYVHTDMVAFTCTWISAPMCTKVQKRLQCQKYAK